jgi:hypothetical protein
MYACQYKGCQVGQNNVVLVKEVAAFLEVFFPRVFSVYQTPIVIARLVIAFINPFKHGPI